MEYIKRYFNNKKVTFFIALCFAVMSVIVGIVYGATQIKGYESAATVVLFILGGVAFAGLSFFNTKIGAAVMFLLELIGFACYIMASYDMIFSKAISGLNLSDPDVRKIIVFTVLFIVLLIASNVFAWLGTEKSASSADKIEQGE